RNTTSVTKALDRYSSFLRSFTHIFKCSKNCVYTALCSCFVTSLRTAKNNWFTSNNSRRVNTSDFAVRIHHPCHSLRVSVYVWSRNIFLWTNERSDCFHEATADSFKLAFAVLTWVTNNS